MARPGDARLVERFFEQARNAASDGTSINIGSSDVILIAGDPALRALFRDAYRQLNNSDMQALIKDYLADVIGDLEGGAERSEIKVDLVDRAGMTPSAGLTVAGILAVATGGAAAPLLLAGGLVGLAVSGIGRTWLRTRAQRNNSSARKVAQLRELL